MKKVLFAVFGLSALMLTGCQSVGVVQTAAKYAVNNYCALTPEARAAVRVNIDPAVAPNQIRITCVDMVDEVESGDVQD